MESSSAPIPIPEGSKPPPRIPQGSWSTSAECWGSRWREMMGRWEWGQMAAEGSHQPEANWEGSRCVQTLTMPQEPPFPEPPCSPPGGRSRIHVGPEQGGSPSAGMGIPRPRMGQAAVGAQQNSEESRMKSSQDPGALREAGASSPTSILPFPAGSQHETETRGEKRGGEALVSGELRSQQAPQQVLDRERGCQQSPPLS